MPFSKVCLGAFFVAALASPGEAQNASPATVTVYEPGSGWSVSHKLLAKGQVLPMGAEITGSRADSSDLVLSCGKIGLIAYLCKEQVCQVPACSTKPTGVVVSQFTWNELQAMDEKKSAQSQDPYLRRDYKPLAIVGVRGDGALSDSVVRRVEQNIHWGPVFARVLEGTYCLVVKALPEEGGVALPEVTIQWDRSEDREGIVSSASMTKGLYTVSKGQPNSSGKCVLDPDLSPVWVLVASDPQLNSLEQEWKRITVQCNELTNSGASPLALTAFRHAALARLAELADAP